MRIMDNMIKTKILERNNSIRMWQTEWQAGIKGKWTRRLIADVATWMRRGHGELNFYLTQFLTDYGHFNSYLHKMKRKNNPSCDYCRYISDDVEHTFFNCFRWSGTRRKLFLMLGEEITADNVIKMMLSSENNWSCVDSFIQEVLRSKKSKERNFMITS